MNAYKYITTIAINNTECNIVNSMLDGMNDVKSLHSAYAMHILHTCGYIPGGSLNANI